MSAPFPRTAPSPSPPASPTAEPGAVHDGCAVGRFTDGGTTVEGSLEVALVAPIVQTATVKDVEAHARWPWNGWVDVDYILETAPTGTVAKVSLSGYDRDHQTALAATTLAGDGSRGGTVEPGKRRISWNLGADYPDFHAKEVNVTVNAVPSEPLEPADPELINGGLAVAFYDLGSSTLPYSTWNASYSDMRAFFASRSPTIVTNTVYAGEKADYGYSSDEYGANCVFPGKYCIDSTDYFAALFWGIISIQENGTYLFKTLSDDGIVFYIDGKLVFGATTVVNFGDPGMYGGSVTLSAGLHEIAIAYHECGGYQGLQLYWQPPMANELTLLPQSILYYSEEDDGGSAPVPPVDTSDWYVSASSGDDSNDGLSWTTAKKSIQAAIDASSAGDTILVADGTYAPIETDNKAITIRSVNGAEKTIIDGQYSRQCASLGSLTNENATVLDGFTICRGRASSENDVFGAGVLYGTLRKCHILSCTNTFRISNDVGGGAYGSMAEDCIFENNYAGAGGGLANGYAIRCIFRNNYAEDDGGGVFRATLYDSLLDGNKSGNWGGRESGAAGKEIVAYGCTIVNNHAPSGGIIAVL